MPKRGLTLGKFAPFHAGHQLVVETALREMDEVLVIVYAASEARAPLSVRASWIDTLYPTDDVRVIEAWDGPTRKGYTPELKEKHEEYILDVLGVTGVDAFYSSEPYGEHVSEALDARNVQVDPDRQEVPISATDIREEPFRHREYVPDPVYRDLVTNVVFLGGPCTGKTTLARTMADKFGTEWMPEYGREYWEAHHEDRRLTREQLLEIADRHLERENEKLLEADEYLFTDTNAVTTYLFSREYHGDAPQRLYRVARESLFRYDVVFLCGTDVPYQDTWDRSGERRRTVLQNRTVAFLREHDVSHYMLRGSVDQRVSAVKDVLREYDKWDPRLHLEREPPPSS